jgi:hypothetical protein
MTRPDTIAKAPAFHLFSFNYLAPSQIPEFNIVNVDQAFSTLFMPYPLVRVSRSGGPGSMLMLKANRAPGAAK